MYADNYEKLARRTTASAPHNASVIGDPAENWTGGENFTRHVMPRAKLVAGTQGYPNGIRDNKDRSACKNAYEMHNC